MMALEGRHLRLQIGAPATSFFFLFMNYKWRRGILPARSSWEETLPWLLGQVGGAMHHPTTDAKLRFRKS